MNTLTPLTTAFHFKQLAEISVQLYSTDSDATVVILLPALGVPVAKYDLFIQQLLSVNIQVVTADYPGCGQNKPEVSRTFDYGYADLLNFFIPELYKAACSVSSRPPVLLGHSLGGHLATLYAQQHAVQVIGIATGNIGLKYWDLKGKFNILKAAAAINTMILKDGYLAGYKIGFGYKEARTLMRDWSRTIFTAGYRHITGTVNTLSPEQALFIHLNQDDFAPLSSTLGLSRYFQNPQVISLDLSRTVKGHQHSAWIKQPAEVVRTVQTWLNQLQK